MSTLHQATSIAIGGRALLIEGEPGSGKSSLALALIDRGGTLIGDDGVMLDADADGLRASPVPATTGLLEIRNVGLVEMPFLTGVRVALVVRLDAAAPRYIEAAETVELSGICLPLVRLWPGPPVLHLRAEAALTRFGI